MSRGTAVLPGGGEVSVLEAVQQRMREAEAALDHAMVRNMFPEYFPPEPGEKRYTYVELLAEMLPASPSPEGPE